ncbi:MAG: EamA family transporter [Sandaracinaceae bacterium]|nr:EamA family transporter [Sandaracinaceae bacterium]
MGGARAAGREPPALASLPYLGASALLHVAYFALLVAAYRAADLSLVYPIARGVPPLLVACASWAFAGEQPPLVGAGGVALVAGGVLALGLVRTHASTSPRAKGILLALATALFVASYTVIDGLGARASGAPFGYAAWLFVAQGTLFAVGALAYGGAAVRREVWARRKESALAGIVAAGGYAIALWAMTEAPIAFVAALRETSVVFAAILGALFLKEPFGRPRVLAAAAVAAGVVAIQLAGRSA